jgi:hypothetical protein
MAHFFVCAKAGTEVNQLEREGRRGNVGEGRGQKETEIKPKGWGGGAREPKVNFCINPYT